MKETLLKLEHASVHYGGIKALDGVSVHIDEGEVVALMGPNGAGKTTVIKTLFGLAPLTSGHVLWHGQKIVPIPYEMAGRGISYVPQGRQVFKSLTVRENLELGGWVLKNRADAKVNIENVLRLFPVLKEKSHEKAGVLSGGQQQMLTIARGLVCDPKVLLLDEPSLGLSPKVVKEVFALVKEINVQRGVAVLIVEHSIKSVLEIAGRAYVLSHGEVAIAKGAGEALPNDALEKVFLL